MTIQILIPEFFVDFDARIHTGGIALRDGVIVDVGDHVLQMVGEKIYLRNQVVLPGFVNGHSHAFQRLLRGLVERKPKTPLKNNFFTWREKMYALAQSLSKDTLELVAQLTFLEMLEAGFTHVAEFHYLHHNNDDDPLALSLALARAASAQKINLTLLECAYQRNNFSQPLKPQQQRFAFQTARAFLAFVEEARVRVPNNFTRIGIALHSVRAVDEEWFLPIDDRARLYDMPVHIHVSEQRAEVDACITARGLSPIGLLHRHHLLSSRTTLVHATHLIGDDLALLEKSGVTICVCPSTEKNLGDGFAPIALLKQRGLAICIGTDQHVRFEPFDEARSLEEQERLRTEQRLVLNNEGEYLFEALLPALTTHGLKSLAHRLTNNSLIGVDANLVGISLPPEYAWHGPKAALDALFIAGNSSSTQTVFTKGHGVILQGQSQFRDKNYLIQEIAKFFRRINLA